MNRQARRFLLLLMTLCGSGLIAWTYRQAGASPAPSFSQFAPEGALLYLETKDFGALLQEWNRSPEKAAWLKSDDHSVFSKSRLFLRLAKALDEFGAAAGLPADEDFLNQVAGRESAVALYDIGNLELLYITHLPPSGQFLQSRLWQSRNKFASRITGDKPFFVHKDEKSERVVAFAMLGDYLLLGTREDLVAGGLQLLSGNQGRALGKEGWFVKALAAAPSTSGDLRMVLNLEKIAVTPQFRTYWVQQNNTEMKGYSGAVCDLYREGSTYREERVILRGRELPEEDNALAQTTQAVSGLLRLVPNNYGFYQAGRTTAQDSLEMLRQKILLPRVQGWAAPSQTAPPPAAEAAAPSADSDGQAASSGTLNGSQPDGGQLDGGQLNMETRIDTEQAPRPSGPDTALLLRQQLEKAAPQALLVVQKTRKNSDGVLMSIPTVVVIAAASGWDLPQVQEGVRNIVAPEITASDLGVQWRAAQKDAASWLELDGLETVQIAQRDKLLYIANDAGALAEVMAQSKTPAGAVVSAAAGFSHARERRNFYEFTRLIDSISPTAGDAADAEHQPQFFSENIAGVSRALDKIESEEMTSKEAKDRILQTVLYRWSR